MEKKNFMGGAAYETPELNVIDLSVEGVLCASGVGVFDEFSEKDI